jgi:formate--tetrahydrofolate ligase
VAVVIVTIKALRAQGAAVGGDQDVAAGCSNLQRHLDNLQRWGVPAVVALNRFPSDTEADLNTVRAYCASRGVPAAFSEGYARGGEGMVDLADKVVAAAAGSDPATVRPLYASSAPLEQKIHDIATNVYGAATVAFKPAARTRLHHFTALGFSHLPVCIAKTQYSFSDDPKLLGAPSGWTLNITDATLSAGAGFVVAIAGSMMLMPGLGKTPQAQKLDVDASGQIVGMDY